MNGYIIRYYTGSHQNNKNYFDMVTEDWNDTLAFSEILNSTFTDYNETISSQNNEFDVIFGNFSISFSLAGGLTSTNGLSVKEFLHPSDNQLYKYACHIEFTDGGKKIGGIIDNESITVDKSFSRGNWLINISVIAWDKEFAAFSGTPLQITGGSPDINSFIETYLFTSRVNQGIQAKHLEFNLNFNWATRNASDGGFTPILVVEAYNQMLINGIQETGWQLFKELAFGLGFVFKIRSKEINRIIPHNFINVELWCGWRSEGIANRTIQMLEPHMETNQINANTILALLYSQGTSPAEYNYQNKYSAFIKDAVDNAYLNDGEVVTHEENGIIVSSRNMFTIDATDTFDIINILPAARVAKGLIRNFEDKTFCLFDNTNLNYVRQVGRIFYFIDRGGPDIPANKSYYFVNSWELASDGSYITSSWAFCRLFVKEYVPITIHSIPRQRIEIRDKGWFNTSKDKSMIQRTAGVEYDYLISGNKKIIKTDIHFNTSMGLEIYDITSINGRNYWLRNLSNIDLSFDRDNGQRATTEWVEL